MQGEATKITVTETLIALTTALKEGESIQITHESVTLHTTILGEEKIDLLLHL